MEYQKIINLLDNTMINHLNLEQEIDLKKMMNHEEHILMIILIIMMITIITLNFKIQW